MAKPAGNRQAKQTKPRCGAGQSCGFACIEASDTCTEKLDGAISRAAVEALRSHATAALATVATESTDFRGKSFDEVQSKFSANDAKHTIASTVVDHGEGITTQKVTLVASDGSGDTLTHTLLRMAAVPASDGVEAQPERIFTLADGAAKEYTDAAKHSYWNESRDAAIRAAISKPPEPTETKAVEPTSDKPNNEAALPTPDSYPKPLPFHYSVKQLAQNPTTNKPEDPEEYKAAFQHMFPDLAAKTADYMKTETLRASQQDETYSRDSESVAAEDAKAATLAVAENKLYGRQPTGKTAAEYNTELLGKAKTFALEQGFDNSHESQRVQDQLAAHDFSHPTAHLIFGGDSKAIYDKIGGGVTDKDGKPSYSAEEGIVAALEMLSRGASAPRAVAYAISFAGLLAGSFKDNDPDDHFQSQEFSNHVAAFVGAAMRHPDFEQISQALRPHNRDFGVRR